MARVHICDICGRQITEENPLVAKAFLTLLRNGEIPKDAWAKYGAHMDIGKCCVVKIDQVGKWRKRKKRHKVILGT